MLMEHYKQQQLVSGALTLIPLTSFPFLLGDGTNNNGTIETNFGQKPFKYAPPQGYLPLNSASVRPNKVVPRSDQYVGITTWSGEMLMEEK